MKWSASSLILLALTLGCGGDDHDDHSGTHTHADGTTHADHGAGEGEDDHDEADAHELGTLELGGVSCRALLYTLEDTDDEVALDVIPSGPGITAVRAWYGNEEGSGSRKAKLEEEGDAFHGHVELPASPPEGSSYWVEIEGEGGSQKASFAGPS